MRTEKEIKQKLKEATEYKYKSMAKDDDPSLENWVLMSERERVLRWVLGELKHLK